MKKYLSIVSLITLLAINSTYTAEPAGKPLTAQEKIRVNTLLVRQKHLNIDIQRLKDQGKKVPAAKDKDLMNVTNAINKYELRDPVAVAQIRKGFSTAAQPAVRPSVKPGKPSRPASKPSIRPTRPSVQPSRQPATKQINPIYDFPAEEKLAPREPSLQPITPPKPALLEPIQPALEPTTPKAPKILNNDNTINNNQMIINKVLIEKIPTQEGRKDKADQLLRQLQTEFDSSNPQIPGSIQNQIYDKVKNELYSVVVRVAKPAPEAQKAQPTSITKPITPTLNPAAQSQTSQNTLIVDGKLNPAAKQMMQARMNRQSNPEAKIEALRKAAAQLEIEFKSLGLSVAQETAIYDDFSKILQALERQISSSATYPATKPLPTPQPIQSPTQWNNLNKYLTTRDSMLDIEEDTDKNKFVSNSWLNNILSEAQKDKPTLSKDDIPAIVAQTRIALKPFIVTQMKNPAGHFSAQVSAQVAENNVIQELEGFLKKKLTAQTGMPLFNGSQPRLGEIYRAAKATNALNPKEAMAIIENQLSAADIDAWNANKEIIKSSLEHTWGNE